MRRRKQRILGLALAAVLLVGATVAGTLAYLTATTDEVKNTFVVGNVGLKLDEAKVDLMGKPEENAARVTANSYKLIPGHTYTKDPTVHVTAKSEDCYVRMFVTFTKSDVLDRIFPSQNLTEIFKEYDSNTWLYVGNEEDTENNTRTYEFRYKEIVKYSESVTDLPALFGGFTLPGTLTNQDITDLADLEIRVTANAIQADGFDDAAAAWAAFPAE